MLIEFYWLSNEYLLFFFLNSISIGNSMVCVDIWHKYHERYFEIVNGSKFEAILKYHDTKYHVSRCLFLVVLNTENHRVRKSKHEFVTFTL